MRRLGRPVAAVLAALHWGCAALVEFPDDPALVDDGPWRCLADPVEPPQPEAASAHVRLPICDALLGCSVPPSGLLAKLCAKLDPNCDNPLLAAVSYEGGAFDFDVPMNDGGFDGYLAITAPPAPCTDRSIFGDASSSLCAGLPECDPAAPDERCAVTTYLPAFEFFNPPIVADVELAPLTLATTLASGAIGQAAGAVFDPTTTGTLVVSAVDCDGIRAEGVTFALDDPQGALSQSLYLENSLPSSARHETDASGTAVFVAIPPGFVNVVAYNRAGVRTGGVGVHIAALSNSFTTLVPSP